MTKVICAIEEKDGGVELSFVTACTESHTKLEDRLAKSAVRGLKTYLGMEHVSNQFELLNRKRGAK